MSPQYAKYFEILLAVLVELRSIKNGFTPRAQGREQSSYRARLDSP
jgi:hypothetical protein